MVDFDFWSHHQYTPSDFQPHRYQYRQRHATSRHAAPVVSGWIRFASISTQIVGMPFFGHIFMSADGKFNPEPHNPISGSSVIFHSYNVVVRRCGDNIFNEIIEMYGICLIFSIWVTLNTPQLIFKPPSMNVDNGAGRRATPLLSWAVEWGLLRLGLNWLECLFMEADIFLPALIRGPTLETQSLGVWIKIGLRTTRISQWSQNKLLHNPIHLVR